MGDWDFLYDMKDQGYSEDAIMDAMSSGAAPWEWDYIAKQERKTAWEALKSLRDTGSISREEFRRQKAEIFR